jgi:competence protein ComEA
MDIIRGNKTAIFGSIFLVLTIIVYFIYDSFGWESPILKRPESSERCDTDVESGGGPAGYLYIDLSGAVNKPGVYELQNGSRIVDVLARGEGFTNKASAEWVSKKLNLSEKLNDSQKVYIPFEWEVRGSCYEDTLIVEIMESSGTQKVSNNSASKSDAPDSSADNSNKVNVNTASLEDLDILPGIGPAYAQKIIDNRPYKDSEEFETKSGIPQATVAKILSLIVF